MYIILPLEKCHNDLRDKLILNQNENIENYCIERTTFQIPQKVKHLKYKRIISEVKHYLICVIEYLFIAPCPKLQAHISRKQNTYSVVDLIEIFFYEKF